ncbi:MAG: bifunctional diaminohydroxyphosphoribosylaminopyrimidine deaminase/5-amino-6-(5-phosphoribosylamino)uracil reductase RibD [Halofilum sp. (in: g-proteobacteria)]|nr:bifunctional diaminohydroxyphosphoribosylaminopyrimidine deaminase/5-amino-6-(5-phosphoribosylamino)uracil reductase RibD [Halofilum sp. (in: g-proteobacteria)]
MASATDAAMMARAQRLAARGLYTTDPNPRVGCVIARGETVVGEGWHVAAGGPHAEVLALQAAGEQARGATAYVTLEPCCHHGRTPPCTQALVEAGVGRVVWALRDPDRRVAGRGLAELEAAGITLERLDSAAGPVRALNVGFVKRMLSGRPWIRVKLAMSLDGRTALASGESRWITGEAARADVHRWRARSSCILTGRGTVVADDPALTVRLPAEEAVDGRRPWIAVADSALNTPPGAQLFDLHPRVVLFCSERPQARAAALEARGAEIVQLPGAATGGVDPAALCAALAEREVNEVHVEAGPTLCGRLAAAGLLDELLIYMAPHLLGDGARGLLTLPPLASMQERRGLHIQDVRRVGEDLRIRAYPIHERGAP